MIDYLTLRVIWWALLGVLLVGFAVMDGFDLGAAMLHPFVARNDVQRRVILNTIGPVWEGNQVWLILAGGATFAAWPYVYSVSFSGFYLAMMLVLAGLILRPVAIAFRSKFESSKWRDAWDWIFFISGLLPSILFGVAFGNLLLGAPFHFDREMRVIYEGGLVGMLHPFAVLCGLVSAAMLVMQGAVWITLKTEGEVADFARRVGQDSALALLLLFSAAGLWVAFGVQGYTVTSLANPVGPSNPLFKAVSRETGAWLTNYRLHPWTLMAPIAVYGGAIVARFMLSFRFNRLAIICSSVSVAGVVTTAGFAMFPFLMPSSTSPNESLTVWDLSLIHI